MIRVGLLGCGRIGRVHAGNVISNPRAQLAAVYDLSAAAAGALGVPVAGSAEAIIQDPTIHAVVIATSTDTHVPLITAAVRAGKSVLCEKPIDLDIARAQACRAEIAAHDPHVMIGFNRRFDPSFAALRARLASGEIGALEQLVITSRDPSPPPASYIRVSGGLFRDMTIHDLDLARAIAGDIVAVHAFGSNLVDPAIAAQDDIDGAMLTLRAHSGALVHINNVRRCAYGYDQRIEAFGARGMLQAANRTATTVEAWTAEHTGARDRVLDFFIERYREAYQAELDHFLTAIEIRSQPVPSFDDGVEALRLADAALESVRTGCAVSLA